MSAQLLLHVGRKFTNAVDNDSNPCLRDCALVSLDCDRWIIWIPGGADCSRPECRRKGHDIGSDRVFIVAVGYEVSDERMSKARPPSCAPASVVARLPSNHPLTQRGKRVLDDIRRLVRANALGETRESILPGRRRVSHLIMHRKKSSLDVDARCCIRLANIKLETLPAIQRNQRSIFRDVCAI